MELHWLQVNIEYIFSIIRLLGTRFTISECKIFNILDSQINEMIILRNRTLGVIL